MAIDVGYNSGCTQHYTSIANNYTIVDASNSANADGTIDSVCIWLSTSDGSNVQFGSFSAAVNNLTTPSGYPNYYTVTTTGSSTGNNSFSAPGDFSAFSIDTGNYIGFYNGGGIIGVYSGSGGSGWWYRSGDVLPASGESFTPEGSIAIAIYGTGTEGGGGETVQIGAASLSQIGKALNINAEEIFAISQATLSQTGQTVNVNIKETVQIGQGSIIQYGQSISLNESEIIQIAQAALSKVGQALNVVAAEIIPIGNAQMLLTGQALIANMKTDIQIAEAIISQVGKDLNVKENIEIANATLTMVGKALKIIEGGVEEIKAIGLRKHGQSQHME